LDPSFHLPPEKQKDRYLQHENTLENTAYVEMFEKFIASGVESFVPPGGKILDFGCGPDPVLAELLGRRGFDVDVVDLFFRPEGAFRKEKYNLITLTEVLEHLTDPLEVLKGLKDRLRPGGSIALMTQFHQENREKFSSWWYRRDSTHVSFYSLKTIRKLGEAVGMAVVFSDGVKIAVLKGI